MTPSKSFFQNPETVTMGVLIVQFFVIFLLMMPVHHPLIIFIFIFTIFSILLRWRIELKPIFLLIDTAIVMLLAYFYPVTSLCLTVFAFYFTFKNQWAYVGLFVFYGLFLSNSQYWLLLLLSSLLGIVLYYWSKEHHSRNEETDRLRKRIYELEHVQSQLLADYQDTEKISRLTERQKIAEHLHDNLGHELTGAHLSLKAYKTLMKQEKGEQAEKLLEKIEEKIHSSLAQLKETVKHIEPVQEIGFQDLTKMIEEFHYPIQFRHSGPIRNIQPFMWQLLLMSTKEALTNITKHARPKNIRINLEVTPYIVRMTIENDGIHDTNKRIGGNGIRYMRSRLEAIHGSLTIQRKDTFKLMITIPFDESR